MSQFCSNPALMAAIQPDTWRGPIRDRYGWGRIRVEARRAALAVAPEGRLHGGAYALSTSLGGFAVHLADRKAAMGVVQLGARRDREIDIEDVGQAQQVDEHVGQLFGHALA